MKGPPPYSETVTHSWFKLVVCWTPDGLWKTASKQANNGMKQKYERPKKHAPTSQNQKEQQGLTAQI